MRISDQQVAAQRIYQLNADYEQLVQAQTVVSTGKQVNAPADNPIGTAVALELQGNLAQNNGFTSTASDTLSWLQTTDTALSGVNDVLVKARTLAVQGANDTMNTSDRQALAAQVGQLLQQAVQSANADIDGRYVLSGFQTNKPPFTASTNGGITTVAYQGDSGVIQREISPGQMMQVNVTGNTALPAVFSALSQLQQDLQNGSTSALGGTDLTAIDQAHDGLLVAQSTVGAGVSRIQAVQNSLQTNQGTLQDQLSQIVDANFAQATITYNVEQATYQAALTTAAKVVQPSLLQFLQ